MFTNTRNGFFVRALLALAAILVVATGAEAAGTPDRIYLFGDDANDPARVNDSEETPTLGTISVGDEPTFWAPDVVDR